MATFPTAQLFSHSFSRGSRETLWNRDWGRKGRERKGEEGDLHLYLNYNRQFSVINWRPRCPLAKAGAAGRRASGDPDAISGVYWPAGCCEAPPRPLIRGLPGCPHCLPDSSVLITQPGRAQREAVLQLDGTPWRRATRLTARSRP